MSLTLVSSLALFGLAFGLALSIGGAATLSDVGQAAGTASSLSGFVQIGAAAIGSAGINLLHDGSGMPIAAIMVFTGIAAACTVPRLGSGGAVGSVRAGNKAVRSPVQYRARPT